MKRKIPDNPNKMIRIIKSFVIGTGLLFIISACRSQQVKTVWLDDLDIKSFSEGIPGISIKTSAAGDLMTLHGSRFQRGIGVKSLSVISFFLDGKASKFKAVVGADDKGARMASSKFYVIGDRKILFGSTNMKPGDLFENINVDLSGIKRLGLLVTISDPENNRIYSDWANAQFEMLGDAKPKPIPNDDNKYILTPTPSKIPRINSASVFGATPGNPFFYTIAATGERPMQFAVKNLPKGLSIDPATGIITGKVNRRGTYVTTIIAKNKIGSATKQLTIKIGDTIGLTPPIGWNGWNSWARNIDREKVIASADAMISSGLVNHGWMYINVDDAWQGQRGGKYKAIQPNEKFPGFKEMIECIHSKGLKFGIYSTPWISSYAGFVGSSSDFKDGAYPDSIRENKRSYRYVGKYRFEKNDAQQMADWGVDYLKYDWRIELPSAERMSEALRHSGRDIFYSLSNSAPFALAKDWERISNAWRTGPDIRDSWLSLYVSAFTLDKWAPYAGPGHWNDPDMLIVGNVTTGFQLHPTRLTPDEQYSHVSIFSLLSAPLIIGCPIEQIDPFTFNLLSNDEVIEVDQDPLGKSARLLLDENNVQVWVKPMKDGSYAVGLFNIDGFGKTPESYFHWGDEKATSFEFDFNKVGLKGKWKLRDVWRQKDLGEFDRFYKTNINHHGVVMLRMSR